MTLRKRDGDAVTEYPVSPEQAASALATKLTFTTGLLSADTLYVWQEGGTQVVAEYRKPQLTGVFLEGSENAVRVPLPGMVLIRVTHHQQRPDYKLSLQCQIEFCSSSTRKVRIQIPVFLDGLAGF